MSLVLVLRHSNENHSMIKIHIIHNEQGIAVQTATQQVLVTPDSKLTVSIPPKNITPLFSTLHNGKCKLGVLIGLGEFVIEIQTYVSWRKFSDSKPITSFLSLTLASKLALLL